MNINNESNHFIYFSLIVTVLVSSMLIIIIIRYYHSSWDSPSGIILLGGDGSYSHRNTEKIQQDGGSSYSFKLKHFTM